MEVSARVHQKEIYTLNQHPIYDTFTSIARIHKSRCQGVEKGIFPLTITSSDTFGNVLLAVFACLEVLVPEEGSAPERSHSKHSIKLKTQTSPSSFGAFNALKQRM